jgi:hypothetical protein
MGSLIILGCKVSFDVLIPVDLQECPFILFLSRGTHTHPPPPPNKLPQEILGEILDMIKRRQSPDLSTGMSTVSRRSYLAANTWPDLFLNAPTMKTFCQQYNGMTLSGIHRRFMDQDRISAITIKEKALSWPEGQDVYRLLHILKVNNDYKVCRIRFNQT